MNGYKLKLLGKYKGPHILHSLLNSKLNREVEEVKWERSFEVQKRPKKFNEVNKCSTSTAKVCFTVRKHSANLKKPFISKSSNLICYRTKQHIFRYLEKSLQYNCDLLFN